MIMVVGPGVLQTAQKKDHSPRPRSRPIDWSRRPRRHGWRLPSVDARSRKPKGALTLWARVRRLLWSWWPWALLSLWGVTNDSLGWALGAGAGALLAYLTTPAARPPRYGLSHEFDIESQEFLATIAGASGSPFVAGNAIELLNNGDAFYPRMLDAITEARVSITIEAYIYWAGEVGLDFARVLAERCRAGVTVKILLDAIGSASIGKEVLETLEEGGCQVAWYNPIHWYTLGRFNNRTHRKSLIVDGHIAFTGGAGIADHWKGNARGPHEWRDMQVRIEGPAVTPLQAGFAHNWLQTTGELLSGDTYYPSIEPRGPLNAQTLMSSPESGGSTVRIMYYLSIVCARKSIYIANPYFIPDAVAIETLIDAKRRGIDVRIMVSGDLNDNWIARRNCVRLFGPLLEAGIEVYEYDRTMLHHKTMVVDGVWLTIGTTNFDNRSFAHNEESNVCVFDRDLGEQLQRIFLEDMALCEHIELEKWRRRGLWARTQEFVAAFFEEQA
jgi:cardiolipin synthase A/B